MRPLRPGLETSKPRNPARHGPAAEGAETGQGVNERPVEQHCLLPGTSADSGEATGSGDTHG